MALPRRPQDGRWQHDKHGTAPPSAIGRTLKPVYFVPRNIALKYLFRCRTNVQCDRLSLRRTVVSPCLQRAELPPALAITRATGRGGRARFCHINRVRQVDVLLALLLQRVAGYDLPTRGSNPCVARRESLTGSRAADLIWLKTDLEGLLHVDGLLSRRLIVWDVTFRQSPPLALVRRNL